MNSKHGLFMDGFNYCYSQTHLLLHVNIVFDLRRDDTQLVRYLYKVYYTCTIYSNYFNPLPIRMNMILDVYDILEDQYDPFNNINDTPFVPKLLFPYKNFSVL